MRRYSRTLSPWSIAVWAFILVYIVVFGSLAVRRHNAFQSTAFDLGNVDQAMWNTRHGRPFAMTNIEGITNRLGTHVEPILPLLSLLYFFWSDPRALLLLQTIVIALGAWPVYLLAKRATEKASRELAVDGPLTTATYILALTFALVYLLFPALQSANLCDFHALALAPTFFLLAFYCLESEQWGGLALCAVLTAFCKEDMALLIVMLGLYAMIVRRRWRVGLLMIILAGGWFVLATGWILPRFDTGGVSPLANRYAYLGDSPLEIAISPVTQPGIVAERLLTIDNLAYLRDLLAPVAFLSLLAPPVLILTAPTLAINLLSTESFMHQLEGGYYYGAPLVPIVVLSAAYGAAWLVRRFPRFRQLPILLSALLLAATLLYQYGHGFTPVAAEYRRYRYQVGEHQRLGLAMVQRIPPDASLATLQRLNPHASQRQQVYAIDVVEHGLPAFIHKTDYVWLDVTNGWPLLPNDLKAMVDNLLTMGYGVQEAADGWLLLRLGAADTALPDAFYDFARTTDPDPQVPVQLQFSLEGEPALECLGLDWTWQLKGIQLTTYWRALRPLPPDLRLVTFSADRTADRALGPTLQPLITPVWYPPHRWQVGEVVAASTEVWPVDAESAIGLGVVQGDDWGDMDRRLPIGVGSSIAPVPLFGDDTWACLLSIRDGELIQEDCAPAGG